MAFQTPRFNAWCQVRTNAVPPLHQLTLRGYSRCQVRGMTSHIDEIDNLAGFQVLLPKWSDVRGVAQSDFNCFDWINVAGWGEHWAYVVSVTDKGAGFTNEYRIATVYWVDHGPLNTSFVCSPINTALEPPSGFTPLPLINPSSVWHSPAP